MFVRWKPWAVGDAAYAFLAHEAIGWARSWSPIKRDTRSNVYTQSPVESRLVIVNQLEKSLLLQ